jgi:hypothetical protein
VNTTHPAQKPSILKTVDQFITEVPWSSASAVLVHRRLHGGRVYVYIRKWNRHRTKGVWYPTKRGFVIPLDDAEDLAYGIQAAARGHATEKPDWLLDWEEEEAERLGSAEESTVPEGADDSALASG